MSTEASSESGMLPELGIDELARRAPGETLTWGDKVLLAESISHLDTFGEPFRVKGAVVFVCLSGVLRCRVNHELREVQPSTMLVNFTTSVIELLDTSSFTAMAAVVSYSYLDRLRLERDRRMDLYIGVRRNALCVLNAPTLETMRHAVTLAASLLRQAAPQAIIDTAFALLAQLIVKEAGKQRSREPVCEGSPSAAVVESVRAEQLFEKFIVLLGESRGRERRVKPYAEKLGVIAGHLEAVVKGYSGRTAADWIGDYALAESKNLLRYSVMSVAEVSDSMGFPSQSAFGKFFKLATGLSPLQWRKRRGG